MELQQYAVELGLEGEAEAILESQEDDAVVLDRLKALIAGETSGREQQASPEVYPEPQADAGLQGIGGEPIPGEPAIAGGPAGG